MVNNTVRDPKTGWLQYFGLNFQISPKGYAENYLEKLKGEPNNPSFEFLGYDTDPDFTAPGAFEGDKPTDLAIMWWRYKEGGPNGNLECYFDKDEKNIDEPVSREQSEELKKLAAIATDLDLTAEFRIKALEMLGKMGSHEALLALLDIAGNERLVPQERDIALRQARGIIKAGR